MKEKCWKIVGKKGTREGKGGGKGGKRRKIGEKEGKRERELEDKGGKGETREKGRLGSPEGRRPATRHRKRRWNFACHVPSTFARKATMFEPRRKKTKKLLDKSQKCTFEQSAHWFVALGSAISGNQAQGNDLGQTALVQEWPNNCEKPTENATKLTAHSSHHCPKSSKIPQKTWQKRQIHAQNHQKSHKNMAKTTNSCPKSSKIPQKHSKNDKFMPKIIKNPTKNMAKTTNSCPKSSEISQNMAKTTI